MTNTISTPLQEATCSFEEVINLANTAMANMLKQVIAFQQTIFTRPENPGVPTQQELIFQSKIINAIDKLRRFHGRNQKTAGITGFIRFVSNKDKALSKTMLTHYTEYAEKKQGTPTNTPTENAAVNKDLVASEAHAAQVSLFRGSERVAVHPSPSAPVPADSKPGVALVLSDGFSITPPENITEDLFNRYKDIIGEHKYITQFDSIRVENLGFPNRRWFEYNLFQYTLPEAERRFVAKELKFHQEVNYRTLQKALQQYRESLAKAAA